MPFFSERIFAVGETIENSFNGSTAVCEGDTAQFPGIHELDTFAEFPVTELIAVGNRELFSCRREVCNAIDAENCRKVLSSVCYVSDAVEVIFLM